MRSKRGREIDAGERTGDSYRLIDLVCAWCGAQLGERRVPRKSTETDPTPVLKSHGICRGCLGEQLAQLKEVRV